MAFLMKNVVFKVGNADFAPQTSSVTLTPSTGTVTWQGFNGGSASDVTESTWTLDVTFAQNWDEDGLSAYLFGYEGDVATVTFEPLAGGASFTGQVRVVPPSVGGGRGAYAESTVSLPFIAKPVRTGAQSAT